MVKDRRQAGFSLTETLLAVGTLAVGLMFIGGTFLTGVFFATTSTERTVAAVAAEEALAKIRIYGLSPSSSIYKGDTSAPYWPWTSMPQAECLYPSIRQGVEQQYSWSALLRRLEPGSPLMQCTVFVSRLTPGALYYSRMSPKMSGLLDNYSMPMLVCINVVQDANTPRPDEVTLKDYPGDLIDELTFVNDGSTLVDDQTGEIYRVLERYGSPADKIRLDRPWTGGSLAAPDGGWVWTVPPAVSGGRNPVVGIYQDVILFAGK